MSEFAQPSSGGDKFEPGDYNGRLLLFYPKSYNPNETTKFGPSTSADVDVIVVDLPDPATGQPTIKFNARVFGNLANSVRDSIGAVVLARLGQGPNTKGNPPWILLPHTDADGAMASPVNQAYQAGQFKQPERPPQGQQPPANDAWAGMGPTTAAPPVAAAPVAAPVAAPAPTGDPNVAKLIAAGIDPAKVAAMDPNTRAMVAATL
ncbi:hypothetical protein ACGFZA_15830 [Streptomyces sp. NPDC048211]|uniref:hypothetical protein n=1 Tax=Streptomyces sp. NPDC048211 TaxID=3365516 RepID=UPI00371E173B